MVKRVFIGWICFVLVLLVAVAAQAQVYLKPAGGTALPLRLKSVDADVSIDGQFAATTLTLTFYNEAAYQGEAEFEYNLPDMSTPTYFAYWAGEEKVVAKVVEKEKAAAIYSYITSYNRDPALVEMVGKNRFRARVFPVFGGDDLKIEIRFVQVLPAEGSSYSYTLPMLSSHDASEKMQLERVKLNFRVKGGSDVLGVTNNYGLKISKSDGYHVFSLNGANYRPPKTLNVRVTRARKPVMVSSYSAKSGGSDGFFVIALTPNHSITGARVSISGVSTYDVVKPSSSVKTGQTVVVAGRYRGSGNATVTLVGRGGRYAENVRFGNAAVSGNLAMKLWAGKRIETLSTSSRNKAAVIKLSQQYCLPSKYTSWLAVPEAEREIYEQNKNEIEADTLSRSLARMTIDGKGSSAQGMQVRARLEALYKRLGWGDMHEQMVNAIREVGWNCGREYARSFSKGNSRQAQLFRDRALKAAKLVGEPSKIYIEDALPSLSNELARELAESKWVDRSGERSMSTITAELSRLKSVLGDEVDEAIRLNEKYCLEDFYWDFARNVVDAKYSQHPDAARAAGAEQKFRMLESRLKEFDSSYSRRKVAYRGVSHGGNGEWALSRIDKAREILWRYYETGKLPEGVGILKLRNEFVDLNTFYRDEDYAKARLERLEAEARSWRIADQIADAQENGDQQAVAKLSGEKRALESRVEALRARMGDPLIKVDAPASALRVVALLPDGDVKTLDYNAASKQWEARFDIPTYLNEGSYKIQIIVVLKDGTRKMLTMDYTVDITPPGGKARASQAVESGGKLRLRLSADDDTARVIALLPWGKRVELIHSTVDAGGFFAIVPLPDGWSGASEVKFILTDKAHNRLTVMMDCEATQ